MKLDLEVRYWVVTRDGAILGDKVDVYRAGELVHRNPNTIQFSLKQRRRFKVERILVFKVNTGNLAQDIRDLGIHVRL